MIELFVFIGLLAGMAGFIMLTAQFVSHICDKINQYFENNSH